MWPNVILSIRLAFKKKETEKEEFGALVDDVTKIESGFSICDHYPSIKYLCLIIEMRRKLQDLVRRCYKIADPIIYDHISKKSQVKKEDHEDLVVVLFTLHKDKDELSYGSQFFLAVDNIKAILLVSKYANKVLLIKHIKLALSICWATCLRKISSNGHQGKSFLRFVVIFFH